MNCLKLSIPKKELCGISKRSGRKATGIVLVAVQQKLKRLSIKPLLTGVRTVASI